MSKKARSNGKAKNSAGKAHNAGALNPISVKSVAEFERYLDGELPVIVDFWATWCGPCRMMAPVFEKVGKQFEGRVRFLKVNTENLPELSEALDIRAIPSLVVFDGRDVVDSHAGLVPPATLTKMAERAEERASGVTFGDKIMRWFGFGSDDKAADAAPN